MLPPVMAVNGPPNPEESDLEFTLCPEPPCSPGSPGKTQPDPLSLSPGPVSPGKKRVRISDSTSVRVIEDHHHRHPRQHQQQQQQQRSVQFSDSHNNRVNASCYSPRARREIRFSSGGDSVGGGKYGDGSLDAREYHGEFDDEEYGREYHGSPRDYVEYTESLCTVDQLTFPEAVPPPVVKR